MTALNRAGWRPEMNVAGGADDTATFTGNRALMLEEALIFEIGGSDTTGVDFDEPRPPPTLARWRALRRSACRGSASPKRCAIIRACRGRIMRSTSGCFRSEAAR
jgi:hypothetical protein